MLARLFQVVGSSAGFSGVSVLSFFRSGSVSFTLSVSFGLSSPPEPFAATGGPSGVFGLDPLRTARTTTTTTTAAAPPANQTRPGTPRLGGRRLSRIGSSSGGRDSARIVPRGGGGIWMRCPHLGQLSFWPAF